MLGTLAVLADLSHLYCGEGLLTVLAEYVCTCGTEVSEGKVALVLVVELLEELGLLCRGRHLAQSRGVGDAQGLPKGSPDQRGLRHLFFFLFFADFLLFFLLFFCRFSSLLTKPCQFSQKVPKYLKMSKNAKIFKKIFNI